MFDIADEYMITNNNPPIFLLQKYKLSNNNVLQESLRNTYYGSVQMLRLYLQTVCININRVKHRTIEFFSVFSKLIIQMDSFICMLKFPI